MSVFCLDVGATEADVRDELVDILLYIFIHTLHKIYFY